MHRERERGREGWAAAAARASVSVLYTATALAEVVVKQDMPPPPLVCLTSGTATIFFGTKILLSLLPASSRPLSSCVTFLLLSLRSKIDVWTFFAPGKIGATLQIPLTFSFFLHALRQASHLQSAIFSSPGLSRVS